MGTFDLQVNGYGGVDFNQDGLTAEDLHRACAALRADGADGILATVITEAPAIMAARIARLAALREADPLAREMVAGIHIEGPFLSPRDGFRGAHPADAILPAETGLAERLLEAGNGLVRLVTLAPEHDAGAKVTRLLAGRGVAVAAGHTDATLDQLQEALDAGLTLFTHLGNGCPGLLPRHDNIVERALSLRDRLWICFIADGVHIPFFALRNYLDLIGRGGRVIATTDAMAAAGLGPGLYRLGRWEVRVGEDSAARSPDGSHLVGSAVSIPRMRGNLSGPLGLDDAAVTALTDANPRRALGLSPS